MKAIMGARKTGKTSKLIKQAAAEGIVIVCSDCKRVAQIKIQAENLGLVIPHPITINELLKRFPCGYPPYLYAFDEVFDVFIRLIYTLLPHVRGQFRACTFTYENEEV